MVRFHLRKWGLAGLVMLVAIALLAACSQPAPAPSPKPSATPTSSPAASPKPTPSPAPSPTAQSAAQFYKGRQVVLAPSAGAGGGTDLAARLFASMWPTYVEDSPMVVRNQAGGGGIIGSNFIWTSKPDGLTIGLSEAGSHVLVPNLFDDPAAKFDANQFVYIGAFGYTPSYFMVGKNSTINTVQDLKNFVGFKFNAAGVQSDSGIGSAIMVDVLGMQNAKLVAGYSTTADQGLSLVRGETDGAEAAAFVAVDWVNKGFAKPPLFVIDTKRSEWYPDVPCLAEIVKLTPKQEADIRFHQVMSSIKVVYMPPGTPADKAEFVRGIFDKIMEDKGFIQLAQKNWAIWTKPIKGADYAKVVKDTLAMSKEDVKAMMDRVNKLAGL